MPGQTSSIQLYRNIKKISLTPRFSPVFQTDLIRLNRFDGLRWLKGVETA
jgi:hypothetical protein